MSLEAPLSLFAGFGIELEYMIVDAETLDVLPVADRVLHAVAGDYVAEVEMDATAWSNELALHVIELKTNGPAPALESLPNAFGADIAHINRLLAPLGGRLLPTAMHPWMDPHREMRLWPHAYSLVYEAFNRIFDCQGHGWANLQSVHLNLPFANDTEFARLHAAIRLLLPIMPALAASSPVVEARLTGWLDSRLEVYRTNARRIPSISGAVIPEPIYTRGDYEQRLLQRLYDDIAPYDPDGLLQHEWLNARGAIARFDRHAIEIRVLDVQECPLADVAICAALVAVLQALVAERWHDLPAQQAWPVAPLAELFLASIRDAERALVSNADYLRVFGFPGTPPCTTGDLWHYLFEVTGLLAGTSIWAEPLHTMLRHGPLARRLLAALGTTPSRHRLHTVYETLSTCLGTGTMFTAT